MPIQSPPPDQSMRYSNKKEVQHHHAPTFTSERSTKNMTLNLLYTMIYTALFLLALHGHSLALETYTSLAAKIPLYFFFFFWGGGGGVINNSTSTMVSKPSYWPLVFTLANQSKRQTPVPMRSFSACPVLCSAPAGSSPSTARTCRRSHEVSWAPRRGFRTGAR
jgi:hypothetical protein